MAQSISDLFARGRDSTDVRRRMARFVDPGADADGEGQPEEDGPVQDTARQVGAPEGGRRAAFRPAETVALRRDVLDAFAAALATDGRRGDQGALFLDAARTREVLGDFEGAFEHLRAFERGQGQWNWENASLRRRVLRGLEADDLLRRCLKEAGDIDDAPRWGRTYAGLEEAKITWRSGESPRRVARRCERATRTKSTGPQIDAYAALWAMQMRCDAALEDGDLEGAFAALEDTIALPELTVTIRQALEARRAVWMHVYGNHGQARQLLDELARRRALPGDLDDLLISLCFEAGERDRAFTVLRAHARDRCRLQDHALPLVMLHATAADNPATGRDVLREATDERDDWTLLRLHEAFLDAAGEEGGHGGGTELIDVLNRRLEGPLSVDERVNGLTRLGRLYEVEAGLEEAAAEVYREALSYDPQHVPALRALGRLYTRRENWKGLAELYEREIATVDERPGGWRRHFQLAELYEHRLDQDERALENYLVVLEERPNYLPALKSSARILGRMERWTRLADLFLRMVDSAPSRRQKLYLLDKVAEVAEDRLQNFEVAIGAWQEILELDPESPRAFTALGRLYSRTQRWDALIALNEAEIELVDDDEEVAAMWLRNAEIAEQYLEDTERAESYYRKTLDVIPDYLPALEALGRIYLRGSRWADIVEMTGRELRTLADPDKAVRQLGALAEIFENRLDRRDDAIAIYEELWQVEPGDAHVFSALARLYRAEKMWRSLEELLNARLQHNPGAPEFAAIQGELAILAEWRTERPERAYRRYLSALQCEPTNRHWLGGVARTWHAAKTAPGEVADQLEDLLMHVTEEAIRDRYFTIVARLRERAEGGPDASRAYRAHGAAKSLENQIVLRLAMADAGERAELEEARQALPHHRLQPLLAMGRQEVSPAQRQALADVAESLPEPARQWLSGELKPEVAAILRDERGLSDDLVAILDGEDLHQGDCENIDEQRRLRLRALQARRFGDNRAYLAWTLREIEALDGELVASRWLELARFATRRQMSEEEHLYKQACEAVFPELTIDAGDQLDIEGAVATPDIGDEHIDRLYEALRTTNRWQLLRRCLEAQVGRPETPRELRLELFEELAKLLEGELDEYDGARDALVHCWQLSEQPRFLRQIVVLAQRHGHGEDALRFQRKHFEKVSMSTETAARDRVESGIWLAQLLLGADSPDDRAGAIDCLEHLVETYDDVQGLDRAQRMLARAHADAGTGRRAVEIFEDVLHFQVRADELDDWRRMIDVYRNQLNDLRSAYAHQWRVVRAAPGTQADLDTLIDLAAEAGETADCIEQLGVLANATADENKRRLLARAAEAADEELGRSEEAYNLFERVLELVDEDDEDYAYFERRRAICLARMAGREERALEAFRHLVQHEPFEPANYRGLEILFERSGAHDRLRVTRQTLQMLGCHVEDASGRGKAHPTRTLANDLVREYLIPDSLGGGLFEVLQAVMPLAEKIWTDDLPQRKAFDGVRIKHGGHHPFYEDLKAALLTFGVTRFKLYIGESGPSQPVVFPENTPVIWINQELLEGLDEAQARFVAGYCAALAWSDLVALTSLDGRQVWHLIEGVIYRQTGQGFSERIDVASQTLADQVSSPFDMKTRRNVVRELEICDTAFIECHCEAWGRYVENFAARAGLLLSGDLSAAAASLLKLSGWSLGLDESATQRRLRNESVVQDLVRLAHSDQYLELRYRAGLAGRPSRLGL